MMKKTMCLLAMSAFCQNVLAAKPNDMCSKSAPQAELKQAVKWFHGSAEKKALYRQAFQMGSDYAQNWVEKNHPKKNTWGVVLDIDETVLDNSWYFHDCIDIATSGDDFEHYVSLPKKSVALPGAVEFTQLIHKLGGYVSFVTNRNGAYQDKTGNSLDATVENLKQQHIEFDQVILGNFRDSKNPSDKNLRFEAVESGKNYDPKEMVWSQKLPAHKVIAYFGDNIQDFPHLKQAQAKALPNDDSAFEPFGHGYFILPNPIYGSWQKNTF